MSEGDRRQRVCGMQRMAALFVLVIVFASLVSFSCESQNRPLQPQVVVGHDASLASLTTSIPNFPDSFSTSIFSYATSVKRSVDSLTVTVFATDTLATLFMHDPNFVGQRFIIDTTGIYGPAPLVIGSNIFVVQVVSGDLSKQELYTLNVQRLPTDSIPL